MNVVTVERIKGYIMSQENVTEQLTEEKQPHRKYRVGKVVSNKMSKSAIVALERQVAHPIYKKYFKQTKRVMIHDENNECGLGDVVRIVESRPLSAKKRWRLDAIIQRAI